MTKYDQGWRELNPVEKVETATDFLITFTGMVLIVVLAVVGGVLLYEHLTNQTEYYDHVSIPCQQSDT